MHLHVYRQAKLAHTQHIGIHKTTLNGDRKFGGCGMREGCMLLGSCTHARVHACGPRTYECGGKCGGPHTCMHARSSRTYACGGSHGGSHTCVHACMRACGSCTYACGGSRKVSHTCIHACMRPCTQTVPAHMQRNRCENVRENGWKNDGNNCWKNCWTTGVTNGVNNGVKNYMIPERGPQQCFFNNLMGRLGLS